MRPVILARLASAGEFFCIILSPIKAIRSRKLDTLCLLGAFRRQRPLCQADIEWRLDSIDSDSLPVRQSGRLGFSNGFHEDQISSGVK
jgi:hypothetical protein